ncbi:MAG TPA: hypothetical protein VH482_12345 [Thermomicrobiales bacterium]|jgi:hypothetical protein
MRRASILCALLVGLTLLANRSWAVAQDATPIPGPPPGTIVPDPSECTVEPRPLSFFAQLAATPQALPADADQRFSKPTDQERPWTMPPGSPADPDTVAAVTATLRQALACLNANDPLRFLSLFSDDMLRLFFAQSPIPPDAIPQLAATPVASPPDQWLGYLSVHDARVLPDGRVAALAEDYDPTEPPFGMGTDFAIFVKVGNTWLIDSLIEHVKIVGEGTPTT